MATLRELGEDGLIRLATGPVPAGGLGIGDDAAVLPAAGPVIATVDLLVEDVHFRRATIGPRDLGWKSLAVNLSDLAAMGGTARAALVGLSLPEDLDVAWIEQFWAGLRELAAQHDVWIAGGDTTGSPGPITIAVTALGALGPGGRALTRDAGRPGDVLFVTGTPGRAAAGLRALEAGQAEPAQAIAAHRRPVPQLEAGRALSALGIRLALLDDSDGLARAAHLLATGAFADAWLDAASLPAELDLALHGGEDYHLVGACGPADWPAVQEATARAGFPATRVGGLAEGAGQVWVRHPGRPPEALAGEMGYAHFARTSFPPR